MENKYNSLKISGGTDLKSAFDAICALDANKDADKKDSTEKEKNVVELGNVIPDAKIADILSNCRILDESTAYSEKRKFK